MCGIAGIAALGGNPIETQAVKRICDVIAHRGPDDAGYTFFSSAGFGRAKEASWREFTDHDFRHVNEHLPVFGGAYCREELASNRFSLALGHRRLSILDLSHRGHQPMASASRRYWVTFNGEIYNYPDLRVELESKGYVFHSRCDTEVLLYLYEEYGKDAIERLDGMFAFAIYDQRENELTLARDRFGVKPLYYARTREALVFSSEIKGVLASACVDSRIHPGALVEYFSFQNTYTRETLFEGVEILQPGEMISVRPGSRMLEGPRRYHAGFPIPEPSLAERDDLAEEVADAFDASVQRQLLSDVEVGSYLSGGMDSGSIVAVAGRSVPRLLTFTAGFDLTNVNGIEQGFDERDLACELSYLMQTEHYDVVLHAGDMPAAMERLTWHMDDPRAGMCHQNWYAAKLGSRFVKVCLAGTGGDEIFGGYPWRYRRALDSENVGDFDRAYFQLWHRQLAPGRIAELFSPELRPQMSRPWESFITVMKDAPEPHPELSDRENFLQRALYFEFRTFLHGLLVMEDHISMAHGLEVRVPFLDNALVDLAWRIPPVRKVRSSNLVAGSDDYLETTDGKLVLRQAMARHLPRSFVEQPKRGFSPPDENWFRGPSMDYIQEILLDPRSTSRSWFDQACVEKRLQEHFTGRENHRLLIWSLLSFEWLQRHFVDSPVEPRVHA